MRLRHAVIVLALLLMLVPLGSLSLGIAAGPAPLVIPAARVDLPAQGDAARGQLLYASSCAGCHSREAGLAPSQSSPEFRARYPTDASVAAVVRSGRHPMPGFAPRELSDQSVADIIKYIRGLSER